MPPKAIYPIEPPYSIIYRGKRIIFRVTPKEDEPDQSTFRIESLNRIEPSEDTVTAFQITIESTPAPHINVTKAEFLKNEGAIGKTLIVKINDPIKFRDRLNPEELCINLKEKRLELVPNFFWNRYNDYIKDPSWMSFVCICASKYDVQQPNETKGSQPLVNPSAIKPRRILNFSRRSTNPTTTTNTTTSTSSTVPPNTMVELTPSTTSTISPDVNSESISNDQTLSSQQPTPTSISSSSSTIPSSQSTTTHTTIPNTHHNDNNNNNNNNDSHSLSSTTFHSLSDQRSSQLTSNSSQRSQRVIQPLISNDDDDSSSTTTTTTTTITPSALDPLAALSRDPIPPMDTNSREGWWYDEEEDKEYPPVDLRELTLGKVLPIPSEPTLTKPQETQLSKISIYTHIGRHLRKLARRVANDPLEEIRYEKKAKEQLTKGKKRSYKLHQKLVEKYRYSWGDFNRQKRKFQLMEEQDAPSSPKGGSRNGGNRRRAAQTQSDGIGEKIEEELNMIQLHSFDPKAQLLIPTDYKQPLISSITTVSKDKIGTNISTDLHKTARKTSNSNPKPSSTLSLSRTPSTMLSGDNTGNDQPLNNNNGLITPSTITNTTTLALLETPLSSCDMVQIDPITPSQQRKTFVFTRPSNQPQQTKPPPPQTPKSKMNPSLKISPPPTSPHQDSFLATWTPPVNNFSNYNLVEDSPAFTMGPYDHCCGIIVMTQFHYDSQHFQLGPPLDRLVSPMTLHRATIMNQMYTDDSDEEEKYIPCLAEVSVFCAKSCGSKLLTCLVEYIVQNNLPFTHLVVSATYTAQQWYYQHGFVAFQCYRKQPPTETEMNNMTSKKRAQAEWLYRHHIPDIELDLDNDEPSHMLYMDVRKEYQIIVQERLKGNIEAAIGHGCEYLQKKKLRDSKRQQFQLHQQEEQDSLQQQYQSMMQSSLSNMMKQSGSLQQSNSNPPATNNAMMMTPMQSQQQQQQQVFPQFPQYPPQYQQLVQMGQWLTPQTPQHVAQVIKMQQDWLTQYSVQYQLMNPAAMPLQPFQIQNIQLCLQAPQMIHGFMDNILRTEQLFMQQQERQRQMTAAEDEDDLDAVPAHILAFRRLKQ